MSFNFSSLLASLESFFGLVRKAPHEVAAVSDAVVQAAAPVIDQAAPGEAAKIIATTDATAAKITAYLGPKLQEGHDAAEVAGTILAVATAGAAMATKGVVAPTAP